MRLKNRLTKNEKNELIQELVKAGAIIRDKPLTPRDSFYSKSLGEKGHKELNIKI